MNLLIDTNIFLQIILDRDHREIARRILSSSTHSLYVTDYTIHSIGTILLHRKKHDAFEAFIRDVYVNSNLTVITLTPRELIHVSKSAKKHRLDFDDAYQYTAAEKHGLTIVSFDRDFNRTPRGRIAPETIGI